MRTYGVVITSKFRRWSAKPMVGPLLACVAWSIAPSAESADERQIPQEYETIGGHALGFGNGGAAAVAGSAAVRANPAMLAMEKQYEIQAAYHWPAQGRDFYQLGVVDGKTSKVAAGLSYTGFTDDYQSVTENPRTSAYDSPLERRAAIGLSQFFGKVALGVGAQFIEANTLLGTRLEQDVDDDRIKGVGLALGAAALITKRLRMGISGENLTNRKIRDYAPRTYRGGVAYLLGNGNITAQVDFRQRDRVLTFEGRPPDSIDAGGQLQESSQEDLMDQPEQMAIASLSARFQSAFRLMAAYGHSLTDARRSLSGGLAVVGQQFSLSYTASRPYMRVATAQQAVSLGLLMAM